MSVTVQSIVEAGYARSSVNDPGKLATDGELVAVINRLFQALFAIAAAAAPDRFVAKTTITLAGAPASGTLAADLIDLRRVQTSTGAKVYVIPVEEIDSGWHLAPAVYRQGGSLVSRGATGDPAAADVLTLWQLDAPAALTTMADTLDVRFPVRHVELIIDRVAMYLASKDGGRNPNDFAQLKVSHDANMEMFLRLSGLSLTALSTPHGGIIVQRLNQLLAAAGGQTG